MQQLTLPNVHEVRQMMNVTMSKCQKMQLNHQSELHFGKSKLAKLCESIYRGVIVDKRCLFYTCACICNC